MSKRFLIVVGLFFLGLTGWSSATPLQNKESTWSSYGGNIHNTKYAVGEKINPNNVNHLKVKWVYDTTVRNNVAGIPEGIVPTPPAAVDGVLYFNSYSDGALLALATNNVLARGAGILHAVDAKTGAVIWKKNYSEYSNCNTTTPASDCRDIEYSRNTPAIYGDYLVVGSQNDRFLQVNPVSKQNIGLDLPGLGAYVLIINRNTGDLLHAVKIDDAPFANITQSPMIYERKINGKKTIVAYVSTTSLENSDLASRPNYLCCKHRGSVVAIDVVKGKIIWQTSTVPGGYLPYLQRSANLYSGASSWGNTPVIDKKRGLLYVTTGNNFNVPKPIDACANSSLLGTPNDLGGNALAGRVFDFSPGFISMCNGICIDPGTGLQKACSGNHLKESDNHPDSILALDLNTGEIQWSFSGSGKYDAMSVACINALYIVPLAVNQAFGGLIYNAASCDRLFKGPDNDFSMGVSLVPDVKVGKNKPTDLILAGQKSGTFWALDADTQEIVWRRDINTKYDSYPTSNLPIVLGGGSPWGLATDGQQVFVAEEMRKIVTTPVIFTLFPAALGIPSVTPFWGKPVISYNNNPLGLVLNQVDSLNKAAPGSLTRSLSGYWISLDIKTGEILWQYAPSEREWIFVDENHNEIDDREEAGETVLRAALQASVVVSNGVVYGAAMDARGTFRALDAKTGAELWKFSVLDYMVNQLHLPRSAVLVNTAPTIVDNTVYWGTGYSIKNFHVDARNLFEAGSNLLFAFELDENYCP